MRTVIQPSVPGVNDIFLFFSMRCAVMRRRYLLLLVQMADFLILGKLFQLLLWQGAIGRRNHRFMRLLLHSVAKTTNKESVAQE